MAGHPLPLSSSRAPAVLSLGGATAFVGCIVAAMVVYPGGTRDDRTARRYLGLQNFLSDLGGTFTGSGRPNGTARLLFIAAMVSVAVSLVALGVAARGWSRRGDRVAWLPAVVAVLSGAAFVRAATIPWNRHYGAHMAWVRGAFGLLGLFVFGVTLVQLRNHVPRWWVAANVAFLVALCGYVAFDQRGPTLETPAGIEAQVAAQKVIVALAVADLVAQAWSICRPLTRPRAGRRAGVGTG
jgi:hypothetical protein